MIEQEIAIEHGKIQLTNHICTDDCERENWQKAQASNGFIHDGSGALQGRLIMEIPEEEAAMLRANYDLDWLAFERTGDRLAMKRLLARFPYWRVCSGEI